MDIIPFEIVMKPLSAALGLSIAVERVLEFLKNFLEPMIGRSGVREMPQLKEEKNATEALKDMLEKQADAHAKEWDEQVPHSVVLVEKATDPSDEDTLRKFVLLMLGFAAGILFARVADVQLFNAFLIHLGQAKPSVLPLAPWQDYVLTGLFIGGGSGPVHTLIQFITERKVTAERAPVSAEAQRAAAAPEVKAAAPSVIVAPSDPAAETWSDIPYDGGVDRGLLENIHKREKDPSLIVIHHTAMSSSSTFEDVVKVIKSRTDEKGNHWLTGYNCVVLADGSIHPFCRWDRYGSHAAGKNSISLGLAFNGNFENDPNVPFSNPSGRYGPFRPTEQQIKAGARVVALWTFLYKLEPDFEKVICPHSKFSSKTCPGSQFPKDEFRKWVEFYHGKWAASSLIKERIAAFDQKPYLHV